MTFTSELFRPASTAAITISRMEPRVNAAANLITRSYNRAGDSLGLALKVCSILCARTARRARFRVCIRRDQPAVQIHTLQIARASNTMATTAIAISDVAAAPVRKP